MRTRAAIRMRTPTAITMGTANTSAVRTLTTSCQQPPAYSTVLLLSCKFLHMSMHANALSIMATPCESTSRLQHAFLCSFGSTPIRLLLNVDLPMPGIVMIPRSNRRTQSPTTTITDKRAGDGSCEDDSTSPRMERI